MSLTGALSNAGSGLAVAARSAELVATNVANALTEGYGRRQIQLTTANLGGSTVGVRVSGVERVVDQVAIGQRRLSEASFGNAQVQADFFRSLETSIGTPEQPSSLNAMISTLEAELISATASPSDDARLEAVVNAAKGLANKINAASNEVQRLREQSDRLISENVNVLNNALTNLDEVNDQIVKRSALGDDAAGLMDERQGLIDSISELIPVQELVRDNGRVALVTSNGTVLLDDNAAQFEFSRTLTITPELLFEDDNLSGLVVTGTASSAGSPFEMVEGGALAAQFAIRDELAVETQAQLDDLARNLVERTATPLVDPTIGSSAGLFTDSGSPFDPLDELGLSSRLTVNASLDAEPWRVRDGMGTGTPSSIADPTILFALSATLNNDLSVGGSTPGRAFADRISDLQTTIGLSRNKYEAQEAFASSQVVTFQSAELSAGVDTDQEMQKLLVVEQAYAANARVIQTIDELMQTLLRI